MQVVSVLLLRYSSQAHRWTTLSQVPCNTLPERVPAENSEPNDSLHINKTQISFPITQAYLQLLFSRYDLKWTLDLPKNMLTQKPAVVTVRTGN